MWSSAAWHWGLNIASSLFWGKLSHSCNAGMYIRSEDCDYAWVFGVPYQESFIGFERIRMYHTSSCIPHTFVHVKTCCCVHSYVWHTLFTMVSDMKVSTDPLPTLIPGPLWTYDSSMVHSTRLLTITYRCRQAVLILDVNQYEHVGPSASQMSPYWSESWNSSRAQVPYMEREHLIERLDTICSIGVTVWCRRRYYWHQDFLIAINDEISILHAKIS